MFPLVLGLIAIELTFLELPKFTDKLCGSTSLPFHFVCHIVFIFPSMALEAGSWPSSEVALAVISDCGIAVSIIACLPSIITALWFTLGLAFTKYPPILEITKLATSVAIIFLLFISSPP